MRIEIVPSLFLSSLAPDPQKNRRTRQSRLVGKLEIRIGCGGGVRSGPVTGRRPFPGTDIVDRPDAEAVKRIGLQPFGRGAPLLSVAAKCRVVEAGETLGFVGIRRAKKCLFPRPPLP